MVIISDTHNYIFIHVPKNAGNSLWQGLLEFEPNGTSLRHQRANYMRLKFRPFQQLYLLPYQLTEKARLKAKMIANGHAKISEIKTWLPEQTFDDYYKFGIVRNPWDRAVSMYSYHQYSAKVREMSFKEYLLSQGERGALTQMSWFQDNGMNVMDKVLKLEELSATLPPVLSDLGINNFNITHKNKSRRSDDYREFYDQELQDLVRKYSSVEIDYFQYDF